MRIFKSTAFAKFARNERISDATICEVVNDAERSDIDADYGGGVIKRFSAMNKPETYKSDAFVAIHQTAAGMYEAGVIDKKTMHRFDKSCLTPIHKFTGKEIRQLREREDVSQDVFAHYLNVTKDYISKWERGEKKPAGPSLKLLSLVERRGLAAIA